MTSLATTGSPPVVPDRLVAGDRGVPADLAVSASQPGPDGVGPLVDWLAERDRTMAMTVTRTDLAALDGWVDDRDEGVVRHRSGRFFRVEGLDITVPGAAVPRWQQPIINQPEVGILGMLVTRRRGVLEFLVQAKVEPGNPDGHQIAPTVQATRSNYTRAHGGRPVPYLAFFTERRPGDRTLADVRQSEQGSWFWRKRNRNMVVEIPPDDAARLDVRDGFRWCTLAEIHSALSVDDVVNMDTRTVLSCLPLSGSGLDVVIDPDAPGFAGALGRSLLGTHGSAHHLADLLSVVTEARSRAEFHTERVHLDRTAGWRRADGALVHESEAFFRVIGVDVQARGREVVAWSQPMFAALGTGLVCFVARRLGGVLHVLVHLRSEPGFVDAVEFAPTVQCTPENYRHLPASARPPFLDLVLAAEPGSCRFDTVMAEEGGRFHHTLTRYRIVETTEETATLAHPDYRWMTVSQLVDLLRHSHYLNVQARTLVTCLQSLAFAPWRATAGSGSPS